MSDFINTIDALGDDVVMDSIIDRTIMEFKDDQLTTVGAYAFYGCSALETIDLPNVTSIASYSFGYCTALETIDLPNVTTDNSYIIAGSGCRTLRLQSLKSVANNGLRNCSSLVYVDLPVCTKFGVYCFALDTALATLILRSETVCTTYGNMFYMAESNPICSGTGYIYVPRALVDSYKVAASWSTYADQFRALEDYTVDGTTTGELDESKI